MDDKKKVADLTIKSATFSFFLFLKNYLFVIDFCIKNTGLMHFGG